MYIQVKGRPGPVSEEIAKDDEIPTPTHVAMENSSDKENKAEAKSEEIKVDELDLGQKEQLTVVKIESVAQEDDDSDTGWQEAVPKNRRTRPSLAKLNTNFMNGTQQTSRSRGKSANFTSPKTSPNELSTSAAGSTSQPAKKLLKSSSLNRKQNSSNIAGERLVNSKPAMEVPPCTEQINKPAPLVSPVAVQAGKLFSYKEVALAPPGTIVKLVADQLAEETAVTITLDAAKVAVDGPEKAKTEGAESENKLENTEAEAENSKSSEQGEVVSGSELMSSPEEIKNLESEKAAKEAFPTEVAVSDARQGQSESLSETSKPLTENDSNGSVPVTGVKLPENVSDAELKDVDGEANNFPNGDSSPNSSGASDGEKQDASEAQKEMSKKLSASAPPYTPTTIPIFGSITVPGFKDHGGILPSPLHIPPMLPVNHVRRLSPHQSVTARVPYGPRLSGGAYNRSGNRVLRNKPSFISTESNGETNPSNGPRIMNPHAAEFIPSHPWVGYIVSPDGVEITQNGYPLSPVAGGYQFNIPAAQPLEELTGTEERGNEQESNNEKKAAEDEETIAQETPENGHLEVGEEKAVVAQETSDEKAQGGKRWGDYSDNETEQIEVTC